MSAIDNARGAIRAWRHRDNSAKTERAGEMFDALVGLLPEHEQLAAAYENLKAEYAEYRLDRQDQMTRIRAALEDAEKGSRTGNLMTPPWVIQSLADIRTAWLKVTR